MDSYDRAVVIIAVTFLWLIALIAAPGVTFFFTVLVIIVGGALMTSGGGDGRNGRR
jgi:hypothetical protein